MRGAAMLTGGVLLATALLHPLPAQADEKKEKTYKAGAAALGVIGAYFILKGKTVPGAIAGAGAYYAYKKSKDAKNDDRYSNNDYSNGGDVYPDDNRNNRASSSNRTADNRYPNYDYSGIAPGAKSSSSNVTLK